MTTKLSKAMNVVANAGYSAFKKAFWTVIAAAIVAAIAASMLTILVFEALK